jgi:hypothetical protein
MTPKRALAAAAAVITVIALIMPGCSDKTITSTTVATNPDSRAVVYMPLTDGWRVSYALVEPETGQVNIEVADSVMVAGYPGFTIRKYDPNGPYEEIFYRYAKGDAIFESHSLNDPGVRILEAPFVIGNSWDRNDTSTTNSIITGFGADSGIGGGGIYKTKTAGTYTTMSIVSVDDILALNDISYGHCIKVAWQTGPSTCNYYWYAPGIGLVKFEEDVNLFDLSAEHTIGIMTDYQKVTY